MGIAVSDTTIQRALESYGDKAENKIQESNSTNHDEVTLKAPEIVYCEAA